MKKVKFIFTLPDNKHEIELFISPLSKQIIDCIINEYSGIAETGNIEYWLLLTPRVIANSLRPLIKAGYIKCFAGGSTMWNNSQYGGSIYKIVGREKGKDYEK